MRNQRQKLTAIKGLLFAALLLAGSAAWAQVVGVVAHLSGPLVAKRANGTVKVLAAKSEVENGDTLVAEKNTYAQIKFIDNGEITLRPNTTFKIENFAYDASQPAGDSAKFELVKGGLRSITGLLGKRNKEKFEMKTPSATIGIRGTTFIATYVPPSRPTADNMRINHDPGLLEQQQGQHAESATGKVVIDRNVDGGNANLATTGKQALASGGSADLNNPLTRGQMVSTMVGSGGIGNGGETPATLAAGVIGTARDLANGGTTGKPTSQTTAGQQFVSDLSQSERAQFENAKGNAGAQGKVQQPADMAAQLAALLNGGNPPPPAPPAGPTGSMNPPGTSGPAGAPSLPPGLHLQVTDGAIVVTNNGGSQGFQAGQFGFVPSANQPPVIVPSNPGIQFVPPPSFNSGNGGPTASTGSGQGQATDCVVR